MKKVIIIQARMGSTRLPGKVMMPILNKPLIYHLIKRMKNVNGIDKIYVATSDSSENLKLKTYLKSLNIEIYSGDENDVLGRFIEIVKSEMCDLIVRVTADNPLTDAKLIDELIDLHIEHHNNYSFMEGLPKGIAAEVVDAKSLLSLDNNNNVSPMDKEHVTLYIKEHQENFKVEFIKAPKELYRPYYSLTVDSLDDFKKVEDVFLRYGDDVTLLQAIDYLDLNK